MSCSTCKNWDSCKDSDNDVHGNIIRKCFVGNVVEIEPLELALYIRKHRDMCFKSLGIIWLDAVKISDRLYNIRYIGDLKRRGALYVGNMQTMQAYFSCNRYKYSIYYDGVDLSLSEERFKELFGVGIDRSTALKFGIFNFGY